jgi:hypothetical protein
VQQSRTLVAVDHNNLEGPDEILQLSQISSNQPISGNGFISIPPARVG